MQKRLDKDLQELKAKHDANGGAEAFPYNAALWFGGVETAEGLEKLRYVPDRALAKMLYDEWFWAQQYGRHGAADDQGREKARKQALDLKWMRDVAQSCLAGAFGKQIRTEAEEFFSTGSLDSEESLRGWVKLIATMDWRTNADATKRVTR